MSLRTKKILLGTWPLIFSGCYICGPLYVESSGEMQQEEDMKAAQEDMSSPGTEADKGMLIEDQGSISPDMSVDLTDLDMFIAQDSMPDIVEAVDMADMMQTPPPAGTCTFPGANSAGGRLAAFPGACKALHELLSAPTSWLAWAAADLEPFNGWSKGHVADPPKSFSKEKYNCSST